MVFHHHEPLYHNPNEYVHFFSEAYSIDISLIADLKAQFHSQSKEPEACEYSQGQVQHDQNMLKCHL